MHKQTVQGSVLSNAKMGGGGMHPALTKHLQTQGAQPKPAQAPQPAKSTLGGGGMHPAVAKHLQGR
jgi:hypothetical protein